MTKKLIIPFLLCAVICSIFCACSKDDDDHGGGGNGGNDLEEQACPSDWEPVKEGVDLQSTMIADVAVNLSSLGLNYQVDEQDMMAAFVNGTCRAVSSPFVDEDVASVMFALTIQKLETDESGALVTLKFYSAKLRHIFTISSPFAYVAEGSYGTVQNPQKPEWKK